MGHTELGWNSGSFSQWGLVLNSVFSTVDQDSVVDQSSQSALKKKTPRNKNRREYITHRNVLLNNYLNVCMYVLGCNVKCIFSTLGYGPTNWENAPLIFLGPLTPICKIGAVNWIYQIVVNKCLHTTHPPSSPVTRPLPQALLALARQLQWPPNQLPLLYPASQFILNIGRVIVLKPNSDRLTQLLKFFFF